MRWNRLSGSNKWIRHRVITLDVGVSLATEDKSYMSYRERKFPRGGQYLAWNSRHGFCMAASATSSQSWSICDVERIYTSTPLLHAHPISSGELILICPISTVTAATCVNQSQPLYTKNSKIHYKWFNFPFVLLVG